MYTLTTLRTVPIHKLCSKDLRCVNMCIKIAQTSELKGSKKLGSVIQRGSYSRGMQYLL